MEEQNNFYESNKNIINKIEEELTVLRKFNKIDYEDESTADFQTFINQTQLGIKIKEEIESMTEIITKIYENTHNLNLHTLNHFDNKQL